MIPLLPPGEIRHSSSNSKLSYCSFVTRSAPLSPGIVLSAPFSTFHDLSGNPSCLKPSQWSVELPSKRTSHLPALVTALWPLIETQPLEKRVARIQPVKRILI